MVNRLAEIIGAAVAIAGFGAFVAAAAMIDPALAVCVAGFFLTVTGVTIVYLATLFDRAAKGPPDDVAR